MARPIRFIHAADLHLDAPFASIDATDPRVRQALVGSTFKAFDRIVAACIDRGADFLIIAGDAFNSEDRSTRAQLRFADSMELLAGAGVEVFVVNGNHDPANGWSAGVRLPASVRVFSAAEVGRFEVVRDGEVLAAVYGRSFGKAAETDNLSSGYRRDPTDRVAIGVLHANVGGNKDYEPYSPCSLGDLSAAGMDYWALGHIHKPQRLSETPRINYPGSPQGLNPKEDGTHGCIMVEIADGCVSETFIPTGVVGWDRRFIDASGLDDIDAVRSAVRAACEDIRHGTDIPVSARLDLTGRSPAHEDLVHQGQAGRPALEDLVESLRVEQMAQEPWIWIDRIRDLTSSPIDLDIVRGQQDFAGDLVRLSDALIADGASMAALFEEVVGPVRRRVGGMEIALDAAEAVSRARDLCLDRLLADGEVR